MFELKYKYTTWSEGPPVKFSELLLNRGEGVGYYPSGDRYVAFGFTRGQTYKQQRAWAIRTDSMHRTARRRGDGAWLEYMLREGH